MDSPILKKVIGPAPAPPPTANNKTLTKPISIALANRDALVARAVGYVEGNRTIKGGFTESYWGHTDPGNGIRNLGSFSVQIRNRQISSPTEADDFWLAELRRFAPRYETAARNAGRDPENVWIYLNVFDLYTQAPAAVTARGGLLERLSLDLMDNQKMINARVQSFYEPDGRLNAPGFGNNLERLRKDQTRRVNAISDVIRSFL